MPRIGLEQLREREKILLFGSAGASKTYSLLTIAMNFPDVLCFLIDPDDGVAQTLKELGGAAMFPNVEYRLVTNWTAIIAAVKEAEEMLVPGDWVMLEHIGKWWDWVQEQYAELAYDEGVGEHMARLAELHKIAKQNREAAKASGLAVEKDTEGGGFGGFNTREWAAIRAMHNMDVVDRLLIKSPFNIAATSEAKEITPLDRMSKSRATKEFLSLFEKYNYKPAGEKRTIYRFSTIALTSRPSRDEFKATILKARGDKLAVEQELDITDVGFWLKYQEWKETQA